MSGRHNASTPPGPSRQNSFHDATDLDFRSGSSRAAFGTPSHIWIARMPTPERNRYSNKESVKVNAGLDFGGFVDANGPGAETSDNQWTSNRPVMDMDFSLLTLPPVVPEAKSTIEQLVVRLLDPPPHAFPHGTLSIQWVIGAVGMAHLAFRNRDERYVLGQDSGLRNQGLGLGIPVAYLEWLCGDEEATSSEQGMCLTRAFFMELER